MVFEHPEHEATSSKMQEKGTNVLEGNDETSSKQESSETSGISLEDASSSDVSFKVGEETFPAHRATLSRHSRAFENMFRSESVVEIADMKPVTMRKMLEYIYAGTIETLQVNEAIDLFVAASRYDLQPLKQWCKDFMLQHISSGDVLGVAMIAEQYSDEALAEASKRVFLASPRAVVSSSAWREWTESNPAFVIKLMESHLSTFYTN